MHTVQAEVLIHEEILLPELEHLQVADLPLCLVAAVGEDPVAEQAAILVHEEKLASVDVHQH